MTELSKKRTVLHSADVENEIKAGLIQACVSRESSTARFCLRIEYFRILVSIGYVER